MAVCGCCEGEGGRVGRLVRVVDSRGDLGVWRECGRSKLQALEIGVTSSEVRSCRLEGRKMVKRR